MADLCPGSPFHHPSDVLEILERYHDSWGARFVPHRNPCPQPISLERKHFDTLRSNQYVVADKSDGVRYALFLTRVGGREQSVLIDRKLEVFQCPVAACKKCFNGSLFDGELLWIDGPNGSRCQTLLIFDVSLWRGDANVAQRPLHARLELIRKVFGLEGKVTNTEAAQAAAKMGKVVCGGNAHGLSFQPKQCMPLDMLDTLLRHMKGLPYRSDGLLLTPVEEPIRSGTHETMFKLKWRHTIDLEVNVASGEILFGLGGVKTANGRSPIQNLGIKIGPRFLDDLRAALRPSDGLIGTIVECELDLSRTISFFDIRRDKRHPNSQRTIERTLINVQEAITAEELLTEVALPFGRRQPPRRPVDDDDNDTATAADCATTIAITTDLAYTPIGP